jgi:glycosyltransferase involved in cell wall biosynthesis
MKVSILVVTFNQEKYIRRALEGVLLQQYDYEREIIVCDDCSTDNTVEIAHSILDGMPNAVIYSNESNLGITKNYQRAFSRCSGEYVLIVEGDDYWLDPLKVKKQVEFMDTNPMFSMCAHLFYKQQEDIDVFHIPEIPKEGILVFDTKDLISDPAIVSNFTTCCYKRSLLGKISSQIFEVISFDWMINIAMGHLGSMARLNEPMSVYRISSAGAWSGASKLDQLNGMAAMIPEYNRIMNGAYKMYFDKKLALINKEISDLSYPSSSGFLSKIFQRAMRLISGR